MGCYLIRESEVIFEWQNKKWVLLMKSGVDFTKSWLMQNPEFASNHRNETDMTLGIFYTIQ